MPASELVIRVGPFAPLIVSALYVAVAGVWGRARRRRGSRPAPVAYPGSRRQAGDLNVAWLRGLSGAREDRRRSEVAEVTVGVETNAAQAARLLADRARANALFHP